MAATTCAPAGLLLCWLLCLSSLALAREPDPARIAEIAGLLSPTPSGLGPRIDDRQAWDELARDPAFAKVIAAAEQSLEESMPPLTDDVFLDYSRTGNRQRGEEVIGKRQRRFCQLVLAECLENKGRFLPTIDAALREIAAEKTWVYPAHDRGNRNFKGETVTIDLFSSRCAWNFATTYYWLGDKLNSDTRELIVNELERRSFAPFEGAVKENRPSLNWLNRVSNWNAVCYAGTVGSALAVIEDPQRRAFYLAAAEQGYPSFLRSFAADGYSTEGVGYWSFGFGHFVMLSEMARQATGGEIDWLQEPRAQLAASYPHRICLDPKRRLYPPFSDCSLDARPGFTHLLLLDRRRGLTERTTFTRREREELANDATAILPSIGLVQLIRSAEHDLTLDAGETPLRGWFPEHLVLVGRPDTQEGLAFAVHGGHNDEPHNQNDVGSYVVAMGGKMPIVDPGAEVYTSRTFSPRRYESQVLNSFGHPVPRVAGQLQSTGRRARAELVGHQFSDEVDTLSLDIRTAYDVEGLEKLVRHFRYSRGDRPALSVTDEVAFARPQEFETALITMEPWKAHDERTLLLGEGATAVRVTLSTAPADAELVIEPVVIEEDLGDTPQPTRLGIRFAQPIAAGSITLKIEPAS